MNSAVRNPFVRIAAAALCGTMFLAAGSNSTKQTAPPTPEDAPQPVATYTAVIKTSMGDIEIELYGQDAPKTVANFVGLAKQNVYDSILFHRIVPGFVVQAGDPKTKNPALKGEWGTGGTSIYNGQEFEDELDENTPSSKRGYVEGVVAMANHGPNTNSSQFFIVSGSSAAGLPHAYTIFGFVKSGMEVVKAMEKVRTSASVPVEPIRILDVTVKELKVKTKK